jgi:hypothetical protein
LLFDLEIMQKSVIDSMANWSYISLRRGDIDLDRKDIKDEHIKYLCERVQCHNVIKLYLGKAIFMKQTTRYTKLE